jgi:hypothetical protein
MVSFKIRETSFLECRPYERNPYGHGTLANLCVTLSTIPFGALILIGRVITEKVMSHFPHRIARSSANRKRSRFPTAFRGRGLLRVLGKDEVKIGFLVALTETVVWSNHNRRDFVSNGMRGRSMRFLDCERVRGAILRSSGDMRLVRRAQTKAAIMYQQNERKCWAPFRVAKENCGSATGIVLRDRKYPTMRELLCRC